MKLIFLSIAITCFSFVTKRNESNCNAEWVHDKTVSNVEFYHMITTCDGETVVLLKLNNLNNYKVKISWKESFTTKELQKPIEGYKGERYITLPKGSSSETDCRNPKNETLVITGAEVSPTHRTDITSFEFKDIKVQRIFK
jgi:hypothetical protein